MTLSLALEILASVLTLAMMAAYPKWPFGAPLIGVAATASWMALTVVAGLPGLWPLNIGAGAVHLWNLWRACCARGARAGRAADAIDEVPPSGLAGETGGRLDG